MGGVEDNQWFDKFMDGIGLVFTKVDKSILKVSTVLLLVWSLHDDVWCPKIKEFMYGSV